MVIINKRNKKHKKYKINKKYGIYKDNEKRKKNNRKLIEKYPFLMPPKNFVKYTILTYRKDKYSFTIADAIPIGYLKTFSYDFFDELKNKLLETDDLYNFKFLIPAADPFGGFNFFAKFLEDFHGNKKDITDIYDKYMNIDSKFLMLMLQQIYTSTKWLNILMISLLMTNDQSLITKN